MRGRNEIRIYVKGCASKGMEQPRTICGQPPISSEAEENLNSQKRGRQTALCVNNAEKTNDYYLLMEVKI